MSRDAIKHADDCKCRECKRIRNEPEKARCDCCGRTRICKQVLHYESTPRTYDPHYCLAECINLTADERRVKFEEERNRRREKRKAAPPLAWPIIGGPLDGKYAVPADFYDSEGRYAEHYRQYDEFNAASRSSKRVGGRPSMVFLHRDLCRPMIRGADR